MRSLLPAGEGHKAAKSKVREERVAGISKVRSPATFSTQLSYLRLSCQGSKRFLYMRHVIALPA